MKFNDLLDEDGQGTRRCDAWLAENIEGKQADGYWLDKDIGIYEAVKNNIPGVYQLNIKNYTTGDSIDPIEKLCEDFIGKMGAIEYFKDWGVWFCKIECYNPLYHVKSSYYSGLKISIAEALFKAYQKEEE